MARRKAAVLDVPQTELEAVQVIADYIAAERLTLRDRVAAEAVIDGVKARLAATVAAREAEQKARFAALKAWWEAGGKDAAGKGRSAEIAGAKLGFRLAPYRVKFAKGFTADWVVTWLKSLRWTRAKDFIRTKVELDKQALIKAIPADAGLAERFKDILTVDQADEFFIDTGLDEEPIRKELAGV